MGGVEKRRQKTHRRVAANGERDLQNEPDASVCILHVRVHSPASALHGRSLYPVSVDPSGVRKIRTRQQLRALNDKLCGNHVDSS